MVPWVPHPRRAGISPRAQAEVLAVTLGIIFIFTAHGAGGLAPKLLAFCPRLGVQNLRVESWFHCLGLWAGCINSDQGMAL